MQATENTTWRDKLDGMKQSALNGHERKAQAAKESGIPFYSAEVGNAHYEPSFGEVVSVITAIGWEFVTVMVPTHGYPEALFKRAV